MVNVYRKEGHKKAQFLGAWPSTAEGRAAAQEFVDGHNAAADDPPSYEVYSVETPDAPAPAPAAPPAA